MSEMSDFLENALVNAVFRNTAYTSPPAVYAALYTIDPSDSGGGTEVAGNGYARAAITFTAPSNGMVAANLTTFPTATAAWNSITAMGIFDTTTGGNLLVWTPLDTFKYVGTNDVLSFPAGSVTVTFA